MMFSEWKRNVWPTLSQTEQSAVLAEVRRLRTIGWSLSDAWIQAACTA